MSEEVIGAVVADNTGATPSGANLLVSLRQRLSRQRRQLLSERIAQFGIDKPDYAHEWAAVRL